jgi:hypothetical protein
MRERASPQFKVIHPEVEVLPTDHSEPNGTVAGPRVWLRVDSQGTTRRIYVAKPGPIATFLLVLAFGVLLTMSFVVALGLFAIFVGIAAIAMTGLAIYGLVRGALKRLR